MTNAEELRPLARRMARVVAANLPPEIVKAARVDPSADLRRWQNKALKALRNGRSANVAFSSLAIDRALASDITSKLASARTADAVREAFKATASTPTATASTTEQPSSHTTGLLIGGAITAVVVQHELDRLLSKLAAQIHELAAMLAGGRISSAEFVQRMAVAIQPAYERSFVLGASLREGAQAALSDADAALITDYIHDEMEYLRGFQRDFDLQQIPDSEKYIANRAGLYADAIIGIYWEGQRSRVNEGYLVWYEAEDDNDTCVPCMRNEAGSPYDVKDAPIPGNDCLGGTRCRCTLRFEPATMAGIAAAAAPDLVKQVPASNIPDAFLQLAKQPTVLLVRHGETDLNDQNRIRAWGNPPLNASGLKGAQDLADQMAAIKKQKGHSVRRLVSSDLKRALQTAAPIGKELDEKIEPMREMRPWDVGAFQGQKVTDALPELNRLQTKARDEQPPGDGESFNQFLERFLPGLKDLMDDALEYPDDFTVAVTHTRCQRAAIGWLKKGMKGIDVDPGPLLTEEELAPGGFLAIAHDGTKWLIVEEFKERKAQDEE